MKPAFLPSRLGLAIGLASAFIAFHGSLAMAQQPADQPITSEDSTVRYPASYFSQYQTYSVNDMLDRIPGITVARGGGPGPQGGPGSGGGRGLGAGGDQILINGRRIAGKENEGGNQLSRIPSSQVDYIEIIRGTSGDLDVRGGTQVINIVLLEAESSASYAYEVNMDHLQDGTNRPGGKFSVTGQRGDLSYFLSAEREPRYEFRDGFETSYFVDGSVNETVDRDETRDAWPVTLSSNFGYEITPNDTANLNLQWTSNNFDSYADRIITDMEANPPVARVEHDDIPNDDNSWEVGGDYMHVFDNGSRWKTLFIVNEAETESVRERFQVEDSSRYSDLYLRDYARNRERIVRSSYIFDLGESQSVEAGLERAQTILDTSLQLGLLTSGSGDPYFGGLTPITNANGTVEEMRYEYFAIHNWQMNDRMTLETTLLFEDSKISQSGDISKSRNFNFFRPKVDYRFLITPSIQFRASIEKDVAQLSFGDFTANIDSGDDEQNAFEGNSDLRQEQSWKYEANLEYRLPEDAGVINTNIFYHDLTDLIDNIDVSTENEILSARGNIGDGERYGFNFDSSLRLGFISQPDMLLTAGVTMEDSTVTDPFTHQKRERSIRGGASRYSFGFRHDLPARSMNWGFNYRREFYNQFRDYDIDKIEQYPKVGSYFGWFEMQRWGGLIYRFEARDNRQRCRIRTRYIDGTIATGVISEIEDSCSDAGPVYAIKIRGTF
ncbi:MAG: TonB-dependent receptor plug domain-containing protein [Gammaproteobacteria bacterium]|nr:TonB-dependent receptor plug domain-containing protein [Pseudomonadales bacterium]MCP5346492.1 TonB-dependent receptor plug domain-containing protein [Pseudomonadales bacterium]